MGVIINPHRFAAVGATEITFVGSHVLSAANGGNVTLPFSGLLDEAGAAAPLQQNDFIVVAAVVSDTADFAMSTSSADWTEETELYADGTSDTNFAVYTKFMGASPDANIVIVGNASASSATAAVAMAFRGVDTANPLDVAIATATGTATGRPNPPSVTPLTEGAWVVVCGGAAAGIGGAFTNPGDLSATTNHFRSVSRAETTDGTAGMGIKTDWASGAFDPAEWTGGSTNAADSWAAATLALRPA
jgi:hypothetical protein